MDAVAVRRAVEAVGLPEKAVDTMVCPGLERPGPRGGALRAVAVGRVEAIWALPIALRHLREADACEVVDVGAQVTADE